MAGDTSFGSALVGAFNTTFSSMVRAQYSNAAARALNQESDANDELRRESAAAQARFGIGAPQAPAPQMPGAGVAQPTPQALAPQAPAPQPAPTPQAPTPQPAPQPAPAPVAPPQGAIAAGVQPVPQPAPAPAPAPAPQPAPTPQPAPAPQAPAPQAPAPQVMGQEGGGTDLSPQVVAKLASIVQESGSPSAVMVAAGALSGNDPKSREEYAALAQQVPNLVDGVASVRGTAPGAFTRADWDGYITHMSAAALRVSPQKAMTVISTLDAVRKVGLQGAVAGAAARAEAGDMAGAARQLTIASSFMPDGYKDTFKPVQGGIEVTQTPEDGSKGAAKPPVVIPAADVQKYALMLADPKGALEYYLNVNKHRETTRHNKAQEGLTAAGHAIQREGLGIQREGLGIQREGLGIQRERLGLDREIRTDTLELAKKKDADAAEYKANDAAGMRAGVELARARAALIAAVDSGDQKAVDAAQDKMLELSESLTAAWSGMSETGIRRAEMLGIRAESATSAIGQGRRRLDIAELRATSAREALADKMARMPPARMAEIEKTQNDSLMGEMSDTKNPATAGAARFASIMLPAVAALNPDRDIATLARSLKEAVLAADPKTAQPGYATLRDGQLVLGRGITVKMPPIPANPANLPRAATEGNPPTRGGAVGTIQSMVGAGARALAPTAPASPPDKPSGIQRGANAPAQSESFGSKFMRGDYTRKGREEAVERARRGRQSGAADQGDR